MAYVPVPKDLTQGQNKISIQFNKTSADFLFSLAAAVGVPLYFLLRKRIDSRDCCNPYGDELCYRSFWQPCMKKMDSLLKK